MHYRYSPQSAFTLTEIIVVTVILGILWSVAFLSYNGYTKNARDTIRIKTIDEITTVLQLYKTFRSAYPEPSSSVDMSFSGAIAWTQWTFGESTRRQTWKIAGVLQDPLYGNEYTYSVTANRKEYQLGYVLEWSQGDILAFSQIDIDLIPQAEAAITYFDPSELSPIVWLDGEDIDGDGDTTDNPSNGTTITTWVNKWTNWQNPTVTQGSITYQDDIVNGLQWILIEKGDGLRINGSAITQWEIYYVLHDSWGKASGYALQGTQANYVIGSYKNYRNTLNINGSPIHLSRSPAVKNTTKRKAFFYSFVTDGINYEFRNVWNLVSQWATNSVSGVTWAFNKAWYYNGNNDLADWGVGEVIIFDSSLSVDDRYKMEWYLAHNWGMVDLLPNEHPYKTNPPETGNPPLPPDTTPDTFTIDDITGASVDTLYVSNAFSISWINTASPISVSGGEISINGSIFSSGSSTVTEGNTVRVRSTSSSANSTSVQASVTVGWISENFMITTEAAAPPPDTTPDVFTFTDIQSASLGSTHDSNTISVSGINSPTTISIVTGQYSVNGWAFTTLASSVNSWDTITVRLIASSEYSSTVSTTLTIGGISGDFRVTTIDEPTSVDISPIYTDSPVYIRGNYNGMITYAQKDDIHYIIATPSIITSDTSITDVYDTITEQKLSYQWYDNPPWSYNGSSLQMEWGFNFNVFNPIIFEGSKEQLWSYAGLKEVDGGIRSIYNNSIIYSKLSNTLDAYTLGYLENILANTIGINPIKPFYCRDILDSELQYNIAQEAIVTATPGVTGIEGITNGIVSSEWALNYEYISTTPEAFIDFEFSSPKKIGYVRIFNRVDEYSDRLSGAIIKLYDAELNLIYSHPLWDTTDDFIVDLDLEWIGHLYDVSHLRIESTGLDSYLNLREVEIYVGWNIKNGFYMVDRDGAGWQNPYEVYCDMETDGWGWTRILENHLERGDFSGWFHSPNYNLMWSAENQIVPFSTPVDSWYAVRQKLTGSSISSTQTNLNYSVRLTHPDILDVGQELRLSAWVTWAIDEWENLNGGKGYIFSNTLTYTDTTTSVNGLMETLEEKIVWWRLWKHQMVRIPIEKEVSDFVWRVWYGTETSASRDFYFTDLRAEIFYR